MESLRSTVASYIVKRELQKERKAAGENGIRDSYEETTSAIIEPYPRMQQSAHDMDKSAEETVEIQSMIRKMENIQ